MTLYTNTTQQTRVFPDLPLTLEPGETGDFPDSFFDGTSPEALGLGLAAKKAAAQPRDNEPFEPPADPAPSDAPPASPAPDQPLEG